MQLQNFSTMNNFHFTVLGYLPQSEQVIFKMIFANFEVINKLSEQDVVLGQRYQNNKI